MQQSTRAIAYRRSPRAVSRQNGSGCGSLLVHKDKAYTLLERRFRVDHSATIYIKRLTSPHLTVSPNAFLYSL